MRDTDGDGAPTKIEEFGPGDGGRHIMFHDGISLPIEPHDRLPLQIYSRQTHAVVAARGRHPRLAGEKITTRKSFAFDESGGMIVEVGSPYTSTRSPTACSARKVFRTTRSPRSKTYGGFWRYDPNKLNPNAGRRLRFSTATATASPLVWQPASKTFHDEMAATPGHRRPRRLRRARQRRAATPRNFICSSRHEHRLAFSYWTRSNMRACARPNRRPRREREDNPAFDNR